MASQAERRDWIKEHLSYELLMLRYTFGKLYEVQSGLDWNAYYESFCTHARLLRDFLTNKSGSTNFDAKEFVDGFKESVPRPASDIMADMNNEVFHSGKSRPSDGAEKLNS